MFRPALDSSVWLRLTSRERATDVTRVLKTPAAELSQNACGERTKNILFSSVFSRNY